MTYEALIFYVTAWLEVLNLVAELHKVSFILLAVSEPLSYSIQAFLIWVSQQVAWVSRNLAWASL